MRGSGIPEFALIRNIVESGQSHIFAQFCTVFCVSSLATWQCGALSSKCRTRWSCARDSHRPFASEVFSDTLAEKLWETWPRKMALGSSQFLLQFPKPEQLTWGTLVMDK